MDGNNTEMTFEEFVWQNQGKEIPTQEVEIITGIEPKRKCKNKLLQKILVKMFGYVPMYKKVEAKVIVTKAEDYFNPFGNKGDVTIEISK